MSQITIIPQYRIVCIDSNRVDDIFVDLGEPKISTIKFDTESQMGVVEYSPSPDTGLCPAPLEIFSIEPWEKAVKEAEETFFCRKNPKTFYSTIAPIGSPIVVTAKGWPQPANSTEVAPPCQPPPNTTLYWNGIEFVWSVFPIDLDLTTAQNYVSGLINAEAYNLLQPSDWYVVRQFENGKTVPEDWATWRESVRDTAKAKRAAVSEKEDLTSLEAYCESLEFQTWPSQPN